MEAKNRKGERVLALPSVAAEHCGGYRDRFELLDMTRVYAICNKSRNFWEGHVRGVGIGLCLVILYCWIGINKLILFSSANEM